ncbi:hypothetical protein DY000_02032739 [Brassica cretica]|uniref:Pex N-terminal domain-containing protein n=1 Tax=Brassica cretica TaxID=69181 RepID=A0ABQ7DHC3_BRACR|nr:hypothetical protein DY000_02032739 [Brassica cretica]
MATSFQLLFEKGDTSVEMRQHELKELMASDVTFQLKHKWRFQQLQPFAVKVTESEDQFYDLMLHRGTLNSEADTLGLLSLCYMGTVLHFYLGSYQKFSEIQRPHLLQKLHSGFIVLLQDNVCFRVLVLLGLSLARTILQRVHNIWHRWRRKNWWFKFKNKAVLYIESLGSSFFSKAGVLISLVKSSFAELALRRYSICFRDFAVEQRFRALYAILQ